MYNPPGRLFIDLDGVLADFDGGYRAAFGIELPPRDSDFDRDDLMWSKIHATDGFFRNLPMLPGAGQLWNFASRQGAYILTGCPEKRPEVAVQKKQWVRYYLGNNAAVITCRARDKSLYCRKGDVLVDDWPKYQARWELAGGTWVTHKDAVQSIEKLRELGYE